MNFFTKYINTSAVLSIMHKRQNGLFCRYLLKCRCISLMATDELMTENSGILLNTLEEVQEILYVPSIIDGFKTREIREAWKKYVQLRGLFFLECALVPPQV